MQHVSCPFPCFRCDWWYWYPDGLRRNRHQDSNRLFEYVLWMRVDRGGEQEKRDAMWSKRGRYGGIA